MFHRFRYPIRAAQSSSMRHFRFPRQQPLPFKNIEIFETGLSLPYKDGATSSKRVHIYTRVVALTAFSKHLTEESTLVQHHFVEREAARNYGIPANWRSSLLFNHFFSRVSNSTAMLHLIYASFICTLYASCSYMHAMADSNRWRNNAEMIRIVTHTRNEDDV